MITAFINQKGGVGKTATVLHMGGILAELGKRVLLIDADPQSSLSIDFGIESPDPGLDDVIMDGRAMADIIRPVRNNLDLTPTSIHLARAELELQSAFNREYRMRDALSPLRSSYDHILIDCPPSLGLMAVNSLAASDDIVIVMSCDYQALMSVELLYQSVVSLKAQINPELAIRGLIRTRYDGRTNHSESVAQKVVELYADYFPIFQTIIRERTAIKDATAAHQLITEYPQGRAAAKEFTQLTKEVFNG
ncbi:MAG: ParA family protein [Chloroflexota bacterium]